MRHTDQLQKKLYQEKEMAFRYGFVLDQVKLAIP
jgi:hypothetical protein